MSDHPYEINKFFADMSDILQVDVEILRSGKKLTEIVRWDSLSVISFIAQVDEEVGITVDPEAIDDCDTVSDLYELISRK